ncbi:MAG: hypothetical protein GTO30_19275, partial [Acidobacteria bacterium]|nr:hypothetical protein [Acidobacteriota bacterium]NIO58570.1 hypothetical protein [Acidobacteriota bacterium]NIQ84329.1 hypothetical protein [Acidobacteriota bacterium]
PATGVLDEGQTRVVVHFEPGLPLADLKARLIVTRLSNLGDVRSVMPAPEDLETAADPDRIELVLLTDVDADTIRAAVNVDGVRDIELAG